MNNFDRLAESQLGRIEEPEENERLNFRKQHFIHVLNFVTGENNSTTTEVYEQLGKSEGIISKIISNPGSFAKFVQAYQDHLPKYCMKRLLQDYFGAISRVGPYEKPPAQ